VSLAALQSGRIKLFHSTFIQAFEKRCSTSTQLTFKNYNYHGYSLTSKQNAKFNNIPQIDSFLSKQPQYIIGYEGEY
jgi:hypothetical protein